MPRKPARSSVILTPYSPAEIDDDEDLKEYIERHAISSDASDETIAASKVK